mgnify:CR=1 FL=1
MLSEKLDDIDASVFSSDLLYDDGLRKELKDHCERWLRAIAQHEGMTCEDEGCPHYGTPHDHVNEATDSVLLDTGEVIPIK